MNELPTPNESRGPTARYIVILLASLLLIVTSLGVVAARPDYSKREAQVAALSPIEKDRLMRNLERFRALDQGQQDRLVQLEAQLLKDPDSDALLGVMQKYYDWSKSLTPGQRYDLRRLSAEERVRRVQNLYAQDVEQGIRRDDRVILATWLEERIMRGLPTAERDQIAARPPLERRVMVLKHRGRGEEVLEDLKQDEVDQLAAQLHSDLGDNLRKAKDLPEQQKILRSELSDVFRRMYFDTSLFSDQAVAENQQALAEFFERLDDDERDRLLSLPPEEMRRNLAFEYYRRHFPQMSGDRRRSEFVSPQRGRGSSSRSSGSRDRQYRSRSQDNGRDEGAREPRDPAGDD